MDNFDNLIDKKSADINTSNPISENDESYEDLGARQVQSVPGRTVK
jgi:hypothetical protein